MLKHTIVLFLLCTVITVHSFPVEISNYDDDSDFIPDDDGDFEYELEEGERWFNAGNVKNGRNGGNAIDKMMTAPKKPIYQPLLDQPRNAGVKKVSLFAEKPIYRQKYFDQGCFDECKIEYCLNSRGNILSNEAQRAYRDTCPKACKKKLC